MTLRPQRAAATFDRSVFVNFPFAIRYGSARGRDFLFMCAVQFQDHETLSDLSGQDARAHQNDPSAVIGLVRSFLASQLPSGTPTRGAVSIRNRYATFQAELAAIAERADIAAAEVVQFEYLRDWLGFMERWLLSRTR